ncbi:SDR family oxidoreductase [Evansella halocellulosilytica]|uniref:SDR family oxidoreductase n=1 Tax=Evansella halocellulosilytica TaxID=2011013 RepID=UPI000BB964EE|nr:SDR family oxidoreductase [Evansella halocellulosilytica]
MINKHHNLDNKVAVITGGGGVLCGSMARELSKHGMNIAILNRTYEKAVKVADDIHADGGTAIAVQCDVTNRSSVEEADKAVIEEFGSIDVLINGAGGNHPQGSTTNEIFQKENLLNEEITSFYDLTTEGFDHVFRLNMIGSLIPSQVFSKRMIDRGGSIINISSMSAPSPMTKVPAYSAAKAAIDNFTQWMAVYFATTNIRVNAIAPGFFLTEQNQKLLTKEDGSFTERAEKIIEHTPMRRLGKPDDLHGTLLWLIDDEYSQFITGICVPVDGGFMAYSGV